MKPRQVSPNSNESAIITLNWQAAFDTAGTRFKELAMVPDETWRYTDVIDRLKVDRADLKYWRGHKILGEDESLGRFSRESIRFICIAQTLREKGISNPQIVGAMSLRRSKAILEPPDVARGVSEIGRAIYTLRGRLLPIIACLAFGIDEPPKGA